MFLKRQEVIEFDPTNKEHRAAARAFLKRKAWVDSPMRFTHDPGYGSVADQVQAKLLDWYVAQEEAREAKKDKNLLAKSGMFMVHDAGQVVDLKLQRMTTDMVLDGPR